MELFRALAVLAEPPTAETARIADAIALGAAPRPEAYTELFVFQLYPYASVYLGDDGMLGGEARDRIAGFWRALGQTPPTEPDHLATLLGLYARLAEPEAAPEQRSSPRREAVARARATLLYEHLLSWLPPYLDKAIELGAAADLAPYAAWARLLKRALLDEAARLPYPPALPRHLRETRPLPVDAPVDQLIAALLAPARSGIIITRSDLARAAQALGLGLRAGERRFALVALLDQDPGGVVEWVSCEATLWRKRHLELRDVLGPIAECWADRAADTARGLDRIAEGAVRRHGAEGTPLASGASHGREPEHGPRWGPTND